MALKWRLCALLFLATTLNYLDRQTVSILAPTLQKELNLDNTALGWLFAVFYYAYTFSQVIVGPLMDRFHLRWAFGMAVVLWSAVSIATGLATGFVGLVVFRLLLGIAEAANWPGATRIVARTFEPAQRSLANGFFTSGPSVGALIAPHSYSLSRPPWVGAALSSSWAAAASSGSRFGSCRQQARSSNPSGTTIHARAMRRRRNSRGSSFRSSGARVSCPC